MYNHAFYLFKIPLYNFLLLNEYELFVSFKFNNYFSIHNSRKNIFLIYYIQSLIFHISRNILTSIIYTIVPPNYTIQLKSNRTLFIHKVTRNNIVWNIPLNYLIHVAVKVKQICEYRNLSNGHQNYSWNKKKTRSPGQLRR